MNNSLIDLVGYCAQQFIFGEWLGQVLFRAHDTAAGAVEKPVLTGQHDDRRFFEYFVVLDQGAGLIAIKSRHHDVDEYKVWLMISNF